MDHQEKLRTAAACGRGGRRRLCAAATIATLVLSLGCAGLRWSVVKKFREPGESMETFPEAVWTEYDCAMQKRPFFIIERNELSLTKVEPGGDFGHRMVYVMCPAHPTEVVAGKLSTRIRFKGDPIVRQMDSRYEIKPGRWVVDAVVQLPEEAEPGIYAYEVAFASDDLSFEKRLTFLVVEGRVAAAKRN